MINDMKVLGLNLKISDIHHSMWKEFKSNKPNYNNVLFLIPRELFFNISTVLDVSL